jgi:hypothetical protein
MKLQDSDFDSALKCTYHFWSWVKAEGLKAMGLALSELGDSLQSNETHYETFYLLLLKISCILLFCYPTLWLTRGITHLLTPAISIPHPNSIYIYIYQ